jgi:uncharacterized membrane protein
MPKRAGFPRLDGEGTGLAPRVDDHHAPRASTMTATAPASSSTPPVVDGAHRSTAAIAGHPLHPMVVPLPIGLLSATAASDVAFLVSGDRFFARASRWLLRGAIASGALAATLGITDFATVRAARSTTGIAHGGGNAAILLASVVSLALRRGTPGRVPGAALALSAVAAVLLAVTGWLGGELSYRERVGVVPRDEA